MTPRHCGALLLVASAMLVHRAAQAHATKQPARYCAKVSVDDTLRPIPASLAQAAARVFGLHAPARYVQRTTVFRCMDGHVLVCTVGANLPCGKAETSSTLPAAGQYCEEHPGSPSIPMAVTGHDTIYRWRCAGTHAVAGEPAEQVDARGFIGRLWKPLR